MTIVNNTVNAVALTILPDAPTDIATGLQIPTIAVATAGGVSVIKHDGTVVNITGQSVAPGKVFFSKDGRIATSANYPDALAYYKIPATNISYGASDEYYAVVPSSMPFLPTNGALTGITEGAVAGEKLTFLKRNRAVPAKGMRSVVTSTYGTGFQIGDIRRAYLANTEVESVSGVELVVNGTFDVDTAGWSITGGDTTLSLSGGALVITGGASAGKAVTSISTVVGESYVLLFDTVSPLPGNRYCYIGTGSGGSNIKNLSNELVTLGTNRVGFIAASTQTYISFGPFNNQTLTIDNISVREAIPDRSYKAAAATVYGALVKSPVA